MMPPIEENGMISIFDSSKLGLDIFRRWTRILVDVTRDRKIVTRNGIKYAMVPKKDRKRISRAVFMRLL